MAADAIHWITWEDDSDVAVLLVIAAPSPPCIYTNTRLVRGTTLGLIDVWARRHIRRGQQFAVIWEDSLAILRG